MAKTKGATYIISRNGLKDISKQSDVLLKEGLMYFVPNVYPEFHHVLLLFMLIGILLSD